MEEKIRAEIIEGCQRLLDSGLIVRTWGNLSARGEETDCQDGSFYITASGRNYRTMTPEEVVKVRMADLSWEGSFAPSSETTMHRNLYRVRPDAKVILHTHQTFASAAGLGEGMKGIPVAAYGISGSEELAENVAVAAMATGDVPAVIMKHHGIVCWGEDFDHAFRTAMDLEEQARSSLQQQGIPTDGAAAIGTWIENKKIMKPYLDDFAMLIGETLPMEESAEIWLDEQGGLHGVEDVTPDDRKAMDILLAKNAICGLVAETLGDGTPLDPAKAKALRKKYLDSYSRLSEE